MARYSVSSDDIKLALRSGQSVSDSSSFKFRRQRPSVAGPAQMDSAGSASEGEDEDEEGDILDHDELAMCILTVVDQHGPLVMSVLQDALRRGHTCTPTPSQSTVRSVTNELVAAGELIVKNGLIAQTDIVEPCSCRQNPRGSVDQNGQERSDSVDEEIDTV